MPGLRRLAPLLVLGLLVVLVFATDLDRYLTLERLAANYEDLRTWAAAHPLEAPLAFGAVYAAVVALSVPGATILTIAGGLMFGLLQGVLVVVVAATLGATLVFLIARTALGEPLLRRARGSAFERMQAGFREDALSYLLVLRLIPLFPFWLVNIVPAFLGVGLRTYVVATAIGIVPGSLVYTSIGNGVGAVLAAGERPDLGVIFDPVVLGPLLGLAVLALLPVAYKRWRRRDPAAPPSTDGDRLRP
ncbi:MAG: TVP38/TMEM64 family protein [Pseudomonadota bacterium]